MGKTRFPRSFFVSGLGGHWISRRNKTTMRFIIKKGLDLPISGTPEQRIYDAPTVKTVAIVGPDYIGMKPTMLVREGEQVKKGQALFSDKKNEGVIFTAPAAGTVVEIKRGAKRVLQSVVIEVAGDESETFESYDAGNLASIDGPKVRENLIRSGLWTALRTRPYSKVPGVDTMAVNIFVNAMDSNPLAADPAVVLAGQGDDFNNGLTVLTRLTEGSVYVSRATGADIAVNEGGQIKVAEFEGPHPAGLSGTHVHMIAPVSSERPAWTINYQDVVAFGRLFTTGELYNQRVISIAGPGVSQPRLLRTLLGARISDLIADDLPSVESRAISGSVLSGRRANGWANYLGRYHLQVSVLPEGRERELFGYMRPGSNKFSVTNAYLSAFFRSRHFHMNTSLNGSVRAMVPIGNFEKVMPLDVLATQLLRAIMIGDGDYAQKLGCLELDEEDLALCSYVCPGKYEYGPILRDVLTTIEREG